MQNACSDRGVGGTGRRTAAGVVVGMIREGKFSKERKQANFETTGGTD